MIREHEMSCSEPEPGTLHEYVMTVQLATRHTTDCTNM